MGDFLKSNPSITREEYLYKLSIPLIFVMSHDFTHTIYLKGENKKKWEEYCEKRKKHGKRVQGMSQMEIAKQAAMDRMAQKGMSEKINEIKKIDNV